MSRENVEVIQRFYEAFNRSDFDEALDFAHPEIELYPAHVGLDVGSEYRGADAVRKFLETIDDGFDTYTVAPEEMIEVGDDRVVVVERWTGRARGIEFDMEFTDVYKFRDGRCVRVEGFRDKAEALEAAELRE
jgi:ketosteroid isomerase-like protein